MIFSEESNCSLISASFNIMPGKCVTERLTIREYRVEHECIQCRFDREYLSEMRASPTHLTMITLPLLTQRLIYVWCCQRLELPYQPQAPELLKVWPDRLEQYFPRLLKTEKNLLYHIRMMEFKKTLPNRYYLKIEGKVNDVVIVKVGTTIVLL